MLRQYGKQKLAEPLDQVQQITSLDVAPGTGPKAAPTLWRFLRSLPSDMGVTTDDFVLGYKPLASPNADSVQAKWDRWLATLYDMALAPVVDKQADDAWWAKYREGIVTLIYDELDSFLIDRLHFWFEETKTPLDRDYAMRHGTVPDPRLRLSQIRRLSSWEIV